MPIFLFLGGLGLPEILVICLVVLLFFGGRKIPELMKGLGKGVRNFKEGLNDPADSDKNQPDRRERINLLRMARVLSEWFRW